MVFQNNILLLTLEIKNKGLKSKEPSYIIQVQLNHHHQDTYKGLEWEFFHSQA